MKKITLITFLFILVNISVNAQKETKSFNISPFNITINHLTTEAIEAINSTENKEKLTVIVGNIATQSDFDLTCEKFPWILELEFANRNEHINNISAISNLKSLKVLNLRWLEASQEKPIDLEPLRNLINLIELDCYNTHVTNTDALGNLTKLEDVSFYMSAVNSISFLYKTPNVKGLSLYGTDHTFENYEPVASLKELQYLNIYMNPQATDNALRVLESLTNLRKIEMANSKEVTSLNFLKNNTNIEEIHANWCNKLIDFSALSGMRSLKELEFTETKLEHLDMLKKITTLVDVDISETNVKNISFLKKCQDLEYLEISETPIQEISPLFKCEKLIRVELSSNIPDKQVQKLKSLNPNITIDIED
ncbi:hypothetical protein EI427_21135 [Flammeovirga pectinis]|uniref:Leucine-rich repeat domain-containing protein n=1 Tax=Flammeovirga pectinis TaxID=2494373 RepID=A0A3Q9FS81_9BACT|nr:hypothetical protein [Flammeovirga pectinis]AZQ64731.1 hypothetical protein EI427_21135 [Flammeovirga pectinis]